MAIKSSDDGVDDSKAILRQVRVMLVGVWTTLAVAVVSGAFAMWQKNVEVTHQYVAMSVGVLSKVPDNGQLSDAQKELRLWAANLLNSKLSDKLKLRDKAIEALTNGDANLYGSGYTDIPLTHSGSWSTTIRGTSVGSAAAPMSQINPANK